MRSFRVIVHGLQICFALAAPGLYNWHMLVSLTVNNVVLIDRLTLNFPAGFCALTGETGAGKSILLDALGLALGARAEAGLVRAGAEQALVTAAFDVPAKHPIWALLSEQGLATDDTGLLLRRTVGVGGRSRAFINDQPVSVALLRQAGALLVEIHGQFDTQGLLDAVTHRGLLDDYAGVQAAPITMAWTAWQDAAAKLARAQADARAAQAEEAYLRGAVTDLDSLEPKAGEEEKLAALRTRLQRRTQILESFAAADVGLGEANRR